MASPKSILIICQSVFLLFSATTTAGNNGPDNDTNDNQITKGITPWTVMIYGGVDSSSESHILPHLRRLGSSSSGGQNCKIVLLIDRAAGHSDDDKILGENFEDTRLFELKDGTWSRISGGKEFPEIDLQSKFEANTGDAQTLRKFIRFGKAFAPATKYALIVFGHGDCRSVCPDITSPNAERDEFDDPLYVAEMTEVIADSESVDLIWFDVCSFAAIENAYQLRPGTGRFSANAMLATAPISSPAPMNDILEAAGMLGPSTADKQLPADGVSFGRIAIELMQQHLKMAFFRGYKESWGCYDLTAVDAVKSTVDQLAVALADGDNKDVAERIRGEGNKPLTMNYLHKAKGTPRMWVVSPHFDLYDLAKRFSESENFTQEVRSRAKAVMTAVDGFVVDSLAGSRYKGFEGGKNGVFIVFPDGDALWREKSQWATFDWYHPDDRRNIRYAYGRYAWHGDGVKPNNGVVENWFELMDFWFDNDNAEGGVNGYRW